MSFDLKNSLVTYYATYPDSEIIKALNKYSRKSDSFKQALFSEIIAKNPKHYGFPDVAAISKAEWSDAVRNSVSEETNRRTFWAVCDECKSYYDYFMMYCPVCFKNGKKVMHRSVKVSETGILPEKLIKYNFSSPAIEFVTGKNCYSCPETENSFCVHFGKSNWQCPQRDWEVCNCRQCCVAVKKSEQRNAI